jgi:hypothetical protein
MDADPGAYDPRRNFYVVRRLWLGHVPGTDWLHEGITAEFGKGSFWYEVETDRTTASIGALAESVTVVVLLMGVAAIEFVRKFGGRLGERSGDAVFDWVRDRARQRRAETGRQNADPPPDFFRDDVDYLAVGARRELADLLHISEERLALVTAERRKSLAMYAVYRDDEEEQEYTVEVERDCATFKRMKTPSAPP